jgi:hypothetical protein
MLNDGVLGAELKLVKNGTDVPPLEELELDGVNVGIVTVGTPVLVSVLPKAETGL